MSQNPEEEEEVVEQEHKTGRSAFFAGVHRGEADTFSGSFRGVKPLPHGGSVAVGPDEVIGTPDCWCGQVYGHDWPGKNQGAKHPRGDQMTAQADEKPYLNPRDLGSWDRKVVRALCVLVNEHGIHYRIDKNGMHVYLESPGGETDVSARLKAGRARPAEQQLAMIERWAARYVRPAKVEEVLPKLAERFNSPDKRVHHKTGTQLVQETKNRSEAAAAAHARKRAQTSAPTEEAPVPTATPKAPQIESSPASGTVVMNAGHPDKRMEFPAPPSDGAPAGYHQHFGERNGEPTNWWKADDNSGFLCKDCDYTVEGPSLQTKAAHQRVHSMTPEEMTDAARKGNANRDGEYQGKRTKARNAIHFLAEEYDISIGGGGQKKLERAEARADRAEAKVVELTRELNDLKTKMALTREALGL